VEISLLCVVYVVFTGVRVLCVRDMYIHWCRHTLEHTHIHILMQVLMYVEVWNIMVCNQNLPNPNIHEQTPDVVGERPDHLSDSWWLSCS